MNKEEYLQKLRKELVYLTNEEMEKEINCYKKFFDNENEKKVNFTMSLESLGTPKELSKKIYLKRGIDPTKLRKNILNNITESFLNILAAFKNPKNDKKKMIIDLVYTFLIIILIKLPFNLVRDVGYSYISFLTPGSTFETIWNLLFLLVYTVTALCAFIILARNFNKKYLIS